jgi:superoxide dismutase
MKDQVQEHLKPRGLTGISDGQSEQHWDLYEAYVKNTNELLEDIETAFLETVSWKRSWSSTSRTA